jgi:hypothetical protein
LEKKRYSYQIKFKERPKNDTTNYETSSKDGGKEKGLKNKYGPVGSVHRQVLIGILN